MKFITALFMIAGLAQSAIIMEFSFILGLVLCGIIGYYSADLDTVLIKFKKEKE